MLTVSEIRKELAQITRVLRQGEALDGLSRLELYGSKQALEWVLGQAGALSPVKAARLNAQVVVEHG